MKLKKFKALYFLTFPVTHIFTVSIILASAWIGKNMVYFDVHLLFAVILGILWVSIANVLNNISDVNLDSINSPSRPLVSGVINLKTAYFFWFSLIALSLLLSYFLDILFVIISIFVVLLSMVYSVEPLRLKKYAFSSHLLMGLGYGVALFILGWTLNNPLDTIPFSILLIFFMLIPIVTLQKDYKDEGGDSVYSLQTLPVKFKQKAFYYHIGYTVAVFLVILFLFLNGYYTSNILYFLPTFFLFFFAILYAIQQQIQKELLKAYVLMLLCGSVSFLYFSLLEVM